jgi:regulator of sirC expression with transglutaminase-like and TPR domain
MSQRKEINALIRLLDDEDPEVYENVSKRIISYGTEVIPELENAWSDSANLALHDRIEELIHIIQFTGLKEDLKDWLKDDLAILLDGALLVARYQFPDLNKDDVYQQIDKARQKIWLELNQSYTPLENINIFNQVFYTIIGFNGVKNEEVDIADFCINHVGESKKGNAISLGILYIILSQQLELPVYGVNLYRHFVLAYQKNFVFDFDMDNARETIFYMNPVNKGVPFQRREIKDYLKSMKVEEKESFFTPATNKEIIRELLYYVKFYFVSKDKTIKAEEISKLIGMFDSH